MPSRRSHVNSHHGCAQCKARRIKCDETYPICWKCSKRGISCSNEETSTWSICSTRSTSPSDTLQIDPTAGTVCHSLLSTCDPISVPIIQLMRHYSLHTAPTFCDCPFLLPLWQTAIPSLAFANPFLLHGVAALSSMHLAHLCPASESPAHVQTALHHQDAALKLIRGSINDINAQNASAVFVSAFFVSIFDIASHSPPALNLFPTSKPATSPIYFPTPSSNEPRDLSLSPQDANASLADSNSDIIAQLQTIIRLLRGVVAIVDVSVDCIRTGPVASLLREVSDEDAQPAAPDIEDALDRLAAFCAATQEPVLGHLQRDAGTRKGPCVRAIANLRSAFRNIGTALGWFGSVFKWACTIDDGFLEALRRGDEGALVVLALYGVLFHALDGFWWTRGWGRALVAAVEGKVEKEEGRELLRWASKKVRCDGA